MKQGNEVFQIIQRGSEAFISAAFTSSAFSQISRVLKGEGEWTI